MIQITRVECERSITLAKTFIKTQMRFLLILAIVFLSALAQAQPFATLAGHGGIILAPDVEMKNAVGQGVLVKLEWQKYPGAMRMLSVIYDDFLLIEPARDSHNEYNVTLTSITYGRRTYISSKPYGAYIDIEVGPTFSSVQGSSDPKANSTTGIGLSLIPGFGYAGRIFCIGLQGQIAPSLRGDTYIAAALNAGFHFSLVSRKKPAEEK